MAGKPWSQVDTKPSSKFAAVLLGNALGNSKKGLGSLGKAKAGPGPSKKRKAPDKSKAGPGPVLPGQSLGRSRAGPGPKCKAPQKKTGQKKALAEGPSGTAYEKWQKHKTTWIPRCLGCSSNNTSRSMLAAAGLLDFLFLALCCLLVSLRYGRFKHQDGNKTMVTTWLMERPGHFPGPWGLGCAVCNAFQRRAQGKGLTSKRKRCSTKWSRYEVQLVGKRLSFSQLFAHTCFWYMR